MKPPIEPRNGHIILKLVRGEQPLIALPDDVSNPTQPDRTEIVAVAPDVPKMPNSNEPMYRVGDNVIGLPGQNIMQLAELDLAVIHYSAIVAIDRR